VAEQDATPLAHLPVSLFPLMAILLSLATPQVKNTPFKFQFPIRATVAMLMQKLDLIYLLPKALFLTRLWYQCSRRGEMHHTTPKALSSGTTNFTFDWTAPAAGSGNAVFNIAGNIVNGDNGTNGDAWDKTTKTLTEEVSTIVKKATITTIVSSAITNTGATISAQINANNASTAAEVQYGTTTTYGTTKADDTC
jgi:hypothetical protein